MAVNLTVTPDEALLPISGVRIGVAQAGVRKADRDDVTVFLIDEGASVAGVFTQNRFCAAPVQVCRDHLAQSTSIRALVINTGNANAGTGAPGLAASQAISEALAAQLGVSATQVLPFSTGVIMEPLPSDRIIAAVPTAMENAASENWGRASRAIMTTDTLAKAFSANLSIQDQPVCITGIAKGAGMIRPNMATMLGFIATDARIEPSLLQVLAKEVADASFNCVTVDGDTSTNDSMVLIATQQAGHAPITQLDSDEGRALRAALYGVAQQLAQAIVRDGEGATKFITIQVDGGRDEAECKLAAYAVAHSPLVKTAFFASDPNLGRILAAVGYAGIADLDQTGIDLHLDDVCVVKNGGRNPDYTEAQGQAVMNKSEIRVHVHLGRGSASTVVWTCDLSYDYVKINADYRS